MDISTCQTISDGGDENKDFKPNHDVFLNPNKVVFVPRPKRSMSTAL